jgi:hypothetical protein
MVPGTHAVVVSKLTYISMRATIEIIPKTVPVNPVLITFSNGSQLETSKRYSIQVFLPKSGSIQGTPHFSKILTFTPLSEKEFSELNLSGKNPIDVDVTPDVPEDFLSWYYEPIDSSLDMSNQLDIYWLTVEGDATISVSGYGAPF